MRLKWEKAIRRGDKTLSSTDVVCDLHFQESDIERDYVTKMPDGTVFCLKRGVPRLTPDAVPSIFASYPNTQKDSRTKKIRKLSQSTSELEEDVSYCIVVDIDDIKRKEICEEVIIKDVNITSLRLPGEYWIGGKIANNLCFTYWEKDLTNILKRVVIFENKDIKVN